MLIKPSEPKGKLDTVTVNGPEDVPDWDAIDWRLHEGNVGRLRRRIFKATREQDWAHGPVAAEDDAAVLVEHAG
jgi:N-terminal domain of reverse transcriptase